MGILNDACHELTGKLHVVSGEAQLMLENLNSFDGYISSFAADRLRYRLGLIQIYIMLQVGYLHAAHLGQGHICVLLSNVEGLIILWVYSQRLVPYAYSNYRVLSIEETDNVISQLISDASSKWAQVEDWLNKYGKPRVFQYYE